MRKFRVNFVDKVAEIGGSLVIHALEEHHCLKIFSEVLHLTGILKLSLKNHNDSFFLSTFDFFGQVDDLFLDVDQSSHIFADSTHFSVVLTDDLCANRLDLCIAPVCNLVNEVSDCELRTLRQNVENMFAANKVRAFDCSHNGELTVTWDKFLVFVLFPRRTEENDSVLVHQIFQEFLFLRFKQPASLVLQLKHFFDLSVVVHNRQVSFSSVNDHDHAFLDVLEGFEAFEEIFGQLRKFVCSCLTDVRLVNHEDNFHLRVYVQQPLNEERVRYFVLLAFVIFESRTVVKGKVFYDQFVWNGGF